MGSETLYRHLPNPAMKRGLRTLAAVLLLSCSDSPTAPGIPGTQPGIRGRVTSIVPTGTFSGLVLVEENPGQPNIGAKSLVTVTGSTAIFVARSGTPTEYDADGEFRALATGQWVRVWFRGTPTNDYPAEGTAGTFVVDSSGVTVSMQEFGTRR